MPSTPRRVPSGHGCGLRSSYLHSPSARPMANKSDARGPLSPGLPQYPPNQSSMTRCSAHRLSSALQGGFLHRWLPSSVSDLPFNVVPIGFYASATSVSTCRVNARGHGIFAYTTPTIPQRCLFKENRSQIHSTPCEKILRSR